MAVIRKQVRLSIDVNFTCQEQNNSFCNRLSEVRKLLTTSGSRLIDKFGLLVTLFYLVSESPSASNPSPHTTPPSSVTNTTTFPYTTLPPPVTTQSFLPHSGESCWCGWENKTNYCVCKIGVYIGFPSSEEGELFLSSDWRTCFTLSLCCENT